MADINNPVDLAAYADTITNNPHSEGENWSLGCYGGLKNHVKRHYADLQEDICVYCRIDVNYGGYGEPIEHIVPKSDKPEWMFEPRNLALSCYPCNTKKKADNTLSATGLASVNYPISSDDFTIYHPHFDTWTAHIDVYYEFFLKPKTDKGRETFEVCQLYRLDLPINKAKRKDLVSEPLRIQVIEKVLNDPSATTEIKDQCIRITKEIIRRDKNRRAILGN